MLSLDELYQELLKLPEDERWEVLKRLPEDQRQALLRRLHDDLYSPHYGHPPLES